MIGVKRASSLELKLMEQVRDLEDQNSALIAELGVRVGEVSVLCERFDEKDAEIARLTRELKDAGECQSAMVIERGRLENRVDALSYECESLTRERDEALEASRAANGRAEWALRERDEAVRVLVWALKHKVIGYADRISYAKVPKDWSVRREVDHDGTDADIYRALREAMGGEG